MKQRIFISSAQKEFAEERQALNAYLLGDVLQQLSKTGRGTIYTLVQKPDINRINRTSISSAIGSEMAQSAQTPSKLISRNAAKPTRKRATNAPNTPKAARRRRKKGSKA